MVQVQALYTCTVYSIYNRYTIHGITAPINWCRISAVNRIYLSPIGTVVSLGTRPAYHLVALQPTSEEAFRAACEKARAFRVFDFQGMEN